jgi:uracil phosphoribosyltransferase
LVEKFINHLNEKRKSLPIFAANNKSIINLIMSKLHIIDHPMIQHKLTLIRDKETGAKDFRDLLKEISMLMGYELTRDMPLTEVEIETPMMKMKSNKISGKKLAIVPVLRAGLGMVDGLLSLLPVAKVGHIGLYRDHETCQPVYYYSKLPFDIEQRLVLLVDPMLATGGSASDAIALLKKEGCTSIRLMCLVAAPQGVETVQTNHPDVDIYVAALDDDLNKDAYILPGLGDAGDRIFGTR